MIVGWTARVKTKNTKRAILVAADGPLAAGFKSLNSFPVYLCMRPLGVMNPTAQESRNTMANKKNATLASI